MERDPPIQSTYSNENEGAEIPSGIVQQRRALFSRGSTRRSIRGYSTMPSSWKEKRRDERRMEGGGGVTLGERSDSRSIYSPPDISSRSLRVDVVGIGISATPSTILKGGPFDPTLALQRTSDCCVIRRGSGRRGTVWTFPQAASSPRTIDLPVKSETLPRRFPVREVTIRTVPIKREGSYTLKSEGPLRVMKNDYSLTSDYGSPPVSMPASTSSVDNLLSNNRELDPLEMRKTCEVIRESLLEEPPQKSLQSRLHTMEIEMAELSRALNSSQTIIDQMHAVAASGSSNYSSISGEDDDSLSETNSQIISLRNQIAIHSQSLSNKDLLVKRLERELNDAQQCNHALNSQLGILSSTPGANLKREMNEVKKELKKKSNDYDDLKKINARLENERDQQKRLLDSRLPPDVQTLMAQKRELTAQLDREQTDKHELFMQMNSLIAQVAQQSDGTKEKEEIERLNREIKSVESRLESEKESIKRKNEELELSIAKTEIEKKKLAGEVDSMGKELHMKSAALQSLMLAKQEPKDDGPREDLEKLRAELDEERRNGVQMKKDNEHLIASSSKSSREFEEKMSIMEEELRDLERKLDNSLKETAETREKTNNSDSTRRDLEDRLRKAEEEVNGLRGRMEREKERGDGLERRLESTSGEKGEELKLLESQLREVREKERNAQEKLREVEERNRQLSEASAVELALLKKSLQEEKEKSAAVSSLESKLQVAQREREEMERRAKEVEKQHEETQNEMKRVQSARGNVHDELMTLVKSLQESRHHNEELTTENGQLMKELNESREENEQMQEEIRVREEEIGEWKERSHRAEESSSTVSSLEGEKEKLRKKYEELLNEADVSQKAIEELEEEKQSLLDSARDRETRMESEIEKAIAETNSSRAELTKMGLRLKDLEAESRKHEGRADELQSRIDSILEDSAKTAGVQALEAAEKSTKMKEAEEFSRKIKKQLEELERDNTEKLVEKEELHRGNVQKLSEQIADLQSKLSSTSTLLTESEANLKRVQAELDELKRREKERDEHQNESSSLIASELAHSRSEMEKVKREKEDLERRLEEISSDRSHHGSTVDSLQREISSLKSQLEEEKKRPNHESEVHRLKEILLVETAAKERAEKESNEMKKELEEERKKPNHEPEVHRLKEVLLVESAAKEKMEREAREMKKALDEERKRPNLQPEIARLQSLLSAETSARNELEKEKKKVEEELMAFQSQSPLSNGHSSPVPPPRKGKDSHSSSISSSNASEIIDPTDRVKVLENQVAKKDRIIGVLRRKIHTQQLALL